MISLAEVLAWKYGYVADTKQVNSKAKGPNPEMKISAWRHPTIAKPSTAQLKKDFAEYAAHKEALKAKKKTVDQISDTDALEWVKQKIVDGLA